MKFEWNTEKEKINIKKRGITFEQASYVFADPFALSKYDDEHSEDEDKHLHINFVTYCRGSPLWLPSLQGQAQGPAPTDVMKFLMRYLPLSISHVL
ncbi:BrnT family toxin [Desulfonema limicola]|uniref:BrnT family toxin n=1 Tax=Desulfonema limicola TaxID=45656 RepID=UPI001A9B8230